MTIARDGWTASICAGASASVACVLCAAKRSLLGYGMPSSIEGTLLTTLLACVTATGCDEARTTPYPMAPVTTIAPKPEMQERPGSVHWVPVHADPELVTPELLLWGSALFFYDESHPMRVARSATGVTQVAVTERCVLALTGDDSIVRVDRETGESRMLGAVESRRLDVSGELIPYGYRGLGTYVTADHSMLVANCDEVRRAPGTFDDGFMLENGAGLAVTARGLLLSTKDLGHGWSTIPLRNHVANGVDWLEREVLSVNTSGGTFIYENGKLTPSKLPRSALSRLLAVATSGQPSDTDVVHKRAVAKAIAYLDAERPSWREERAAADHRLVRTHDSTVWLDELDLVERHAGKQPRRHRAVAPHADCQLRLWGDRVIASCDRGPNVPRLSVWTGERFDVGPFEPWRDGGAVPTIFSDDGQHVVAPGSCLDLQELLGVAPTGESDDSFSCAYNTATQAMQSIPSKRIVQMSGSTVLAEQPGEWAHILVDEGKVKRVDPPEGMDAVSAALASDLSVIGILVSKSSSTETHLGVWRRGQWQLIPVQARWTNLLPWGKERWLAIWGGGFKHLRLREGGWKITTVPSPDGGDFFARRPGSTDWCEGDLCVVNGQVLLEGDPPFSVEGERTLLRPAGSGVTEPPEPSEHDRDEAPIRFACTDSEPIHESSLNRGSSGWASLRTLRSASAEWLLGWRQPGRAGFIPRQTRWRLPEHLRSHAQSAEFDLLALGNAGIVAEAEVTTDDVLAVSKNLLWLPARGDAVTVDASDFYDLVGSADGESLLTLDARDAQYMAKLDSSGRVKAERFTRPGSERSRPAMLHGTIGWLTDDASFVPADPSQPPISVQSALVDEKIALCSPGADGMLLSYSHDATGSTTSEYFSFCRATILASPRSACVNHVMCRGHNKKALSVSAVRGVLMGVVARTSLRSIGAEFGEAAESVPVQCTLGARR